MPGPSIPQPNQSVLPVTLTYDEWLSALCLWREARGSSMEALAAIYNVILNRSTDPAYRWPRQVPGVILQRLQFSSFNVNDPNSTKFPTPPPVGTNPSPDWIAFLNCIHTVLAHTSESLDSTHGANGYESLSPSDPKPIWADPAKITLTLPPFRFYRV